MTKIKSLIDSMLTLSLLSDTSTLPNRNKKRIGQVFAIGILIMLLAPIGALADDTLAINVSILTLNASESKSVLYSIIQNGTNGCDVSGSPASQQAKITPNMPSGITASPVSVNITGCGSTSAQKIKFTVSSSIATGSYPITSIVVGGKDSITASTGQVTINVPVPPDTPAVISILGENPASVNVGVVYTDAGATATDFPDGDITSKITKTTALNTAIVGKYYVNYSVTDSASHTTKASRVVNVVTPTPLLSGNGTVIIAFDDGWTDTYLQAKSVLENNGQRGIVFAIPQVVIGGYTDYSPLTDLRTMYNNGWDISSHSMTHGEGFPNIPNPPTNGNWAEFYLTRANNSQEKYELGDSKDWLDSNGFTRSSMFFAYPFGTYDTVYCNSLGLNTTTCGTNDLTVDIKAAGYYVGARSIDAYSWRHSGRHPKYKNGDSDSEVLKMATMAIDNTLNSYPSAVIDEINKTITENGLLVLTFHHITTGNPTSAEEYSKANLTIISNYLAANTDKVKVQTFSQYFQVPNPIPIYNPPTPSAKPPIIGKDYIKVQWIDGTGDKTDVYDVLVNGNWTYNVVKRYINITNVTINTPVNVQVYAINRSWGRTNKNNTPLITNASIQTFLPSTPINTTAPGNKNLSWEAGLGNVTNYYNVSVNGVWSNGTTVTYNDTTELSPGTYTVSVYAVNSTNRITLNTTPLTLSSTIIAPTYMPPIPIDMTTPGSKNLSWAAGSGNGTDYYNVSVNGVWSNGSTVAYKDTTGLSQGKYTVSIYAVNSTNGITLNPAPLTLSATIIAPTYMPPTPTISNSSGINWILTQWESGTLGNETDVFDVKVNGIMVEMGTINKSYNATNLSVGNYSHVMVYAVNMTNNRSVNSTPGEMNTSILAPVLTTTYVYSSGGGSSGGSGGGGGGGIGTSEPYSNIYKYEIQEHEVFTTPISFKYTNPEIPVYEVMVTCNQSNIASIRIEVLKDTSKLVGMPSPGIVYKNINIWIDYKRIKNALIRFKVENSWISSNGLSSADIKIFRWNNNSREWIGLSTGVLNKDVKYTYFESHADSLSASFAISGIKEENVPSRTGSSINLAQVEIEQTENKPVSTKIPETPGFEIILSTVSILSMVYLLKRIKR